jgi:hypothetical protein
MRERKRRRERKSKGGNRQEVRERERIEGVQEGKREGFSRVIVKRIEEIWPEEGG